MIFQNFKDYLLEQYKNSENLIQILEVIFEQCAELELVFNSISNIFDLQNQSGATLDLIGEIVGQKREGLIDSEYIKKIKFAIFKNTSRGFLTDIVKILKFITDAQTIVYSDNPPASYTIYTDGEEIPADLQKTIDNLSVAGVSVIVYCSKGEIPFIAKNISTTPENLIDDAGNSMIDDAVNQISLDKAIIVDNLQLIFKGGNFGFVEIFSLTSNNNEVIITDQGATIGVYDENQNIVDSAKANFIAS
jgi:hypothetical protein